MHAFCLQPVAYWFRNLKSFFKMFNIYLW